MALHIDHSGHGNNPPATAHERITMRASEEMFLRDDNR
jgi:hypothetical protein